MSRAPTVAPTTLCFFWICSQTMSSADPSAIAYTIRTVLDFCPILCILSSACSIVPGDQASSAKRAVLAAVRFRPVPHALRDSKATSAYAYISYIHKHRS